MFGLKCMAPLRIFFFFQIIFLFFSFLILFVPERLDPLTVVRALFLNKMSPVLEFTGSVDLFPMCPLSLPSLQHPCSRRDPPILWMIQSPQSLPQQPRSRARVFSRPSEERWPRAWIQGANPPRGKELDHPAGLWACLYDSGCRAIWMAPIPPLFIL